MARWARNTVVKFIGGELTIRDDADVLRHGARVFDAMWVRGRDFAPVFSQQRPRFQAMSALMFKNEGWPSRWPALSPGYAAWKQKHYPGKPMMRRSDRLYDSLVGVTSDSVWKVTKQSIQFGTRVPYWREHQYGDPTRHLPARPTVAMDYYTLSFIGDDCVEWVAAGDRVANVKVGAGARIKGMLKRMLGPAEKYIDFLIR